MSFLFSHPELLLIAPIYAFIVIRRWLDARRSAGSSKILSQRAAVKYGLHGAAALLLIFAAAGLHLPSDRPHQQIVIAADVSASVFDQATQNSRVSDLVRGLDPQNAEVAVAVFGATAGSERRMGPLVVPESARDRDPLRRRTQRASAAFPDLTHLTTLVDRNATDIGNAINFSRGLFTAENHGAARGILLLSDFRNTRGSPESAVAALAGSGIDLLTAPVLLGPADDVHIVSLRVPESGQLGRALPIEVTVASQNPCKVRVKVWRKKSGNDEVLVEMKTVELMAEAATKGAEIHRVVRILDHPDAPGVAVYTANISGPDGEISGDISSNNRQSAATRIAGPSRWAVLTRAGSTLDNLARNPAKPLGAETIVFDMQHLPQNAAAYDATSGILVDGLSAVDLPDGAALSSIAQAVDGGKALVALGGERAFGAGGHREGTWERLLPAEMTPEDDRTRSVLFLIDVSKSMDDRMGGGGSGVRKIDFANEQLAQAVQKLKPLDRLGLITFSGSAQLAASLSSDPSRGAFLSAVKKISIVANTDLLPAINKAAEVLKEDDAEEQLVVLLSDGVQTAKTPPEEIVEATRKLCPAAKEGGAPRRTTLFTFGIGVDPQDTQATGEKLLKALAEAGGGTYSPDFLKLAERLERAFDSQKKDFFVRRETVGMRAAYEHPLLGASGGNWSAVPFRNRVRAKSGAETLLWGVKAGSDESASSRRPDPLLVLSGSQWSGASRRAVLALSLDGTAGSALLSSDSGRKLLPALLEWMEAKKGSHIDGWTIQAEPGDDDSLDIDVRAVDPTTNLPINGRKLSAVLTALQIDAADAQLPAPVFTPLHPSAPGVYRAIVPALTQGVYRLSLLEENRTIGERFVSVPFPAELRRFGVDRAAMQQLVAKAGSGSRTIESARDLAQWAAEKAAARDTTPLAPWLVVVAIGLLLAEFAKRRT